MNHPDFLIWILGYPLIAAIQQVAHAYAYPKIRYDDPVLFWVAVTRLAIWVYIGKLLY